MFASWLNLTMLAAESQQVIWLRVLKIGRGGRSANEEAQLMISEKIIANSQAAARLMMGATPDSVVETYRHTVRANARRLSP